ncbi:MAG: OmpA family protein [Bdellovibrionales bacterium]
MKKHRWRRKGGAGRDHSDDWLMTYADMITLLLCFFAVFLFASVSVNRQLEKEKAQLVEEAKAFPGEETLPPRIEPRPPVQDLTPAPVLKGNLPFHDPLADPAPEPSPPTVSKEQLDELLLAAALPELNLDLDAPEKDDPSPPPKPEAKGDRLTVMEMNSAAFFDSGSAILRPKGKEVLTQVAEKIKGDAFKAYRITVEGHTDDTPISTLQFPSNWELSTARAAAVVHFFLEQGLPAERLRAAGYADTFPKVPNRDDKGTALPENQAKNRRVVIKLEKIEKE